MQPNQHYLSLLCRAFISLSLTVGPASADERISPKTYDFAAAIEAYTERNPRLSAEEARDQALMQLLRPMGNPGIKLRHRPQTEDRFQVWATESQHETIASVAGWLQHGKQICIEMRLVSVSEETRAALHKRLAAKWELSCYDRHGPLVKAPSDPTAWKEAAAGDFVSSVTRTIRQSPGQVAPLTAAEADAVQQDSLPDSQTLQAPKITVLPGQSAAIKDATQRPFVVSVKPIKGDSATAMQPIIEVLEEGLTVNLKAELHGENQVMLNSEITSSEITDVETFTFQPADVTDEVTVQMPERNLQTVRLAKVMDDGATLLIDPHFAKQSEEKRWGRKITSRSYTLVLLTPTILREAPVQEDPQASGPAPQTLGHRGPQNASQTGGSPARG
ncbi:MAG: hypothetical protein AAGF97_16610 [Planctomycetota bacterium]